MDCFQRCWKGVHLAYSVPMLLLLTLNISLTQALAPIIYGSISGTQVKFYPLYIQTKTFLKLSMIVVYLHKDYIGLYPYILIYFIGFTASVIAICSSKFVNIPLIRFWYRFIAGLSLLYLVSATVAETLMSDQFKIGMLFAGTGGVIFIALFGGWVFSKRIPNVFKEDVEVEVNEWFKFAFHWNYLPYQAEVHRRRD